MEPSSRFRSARAEPEFHFTRKMLEAALQSDGRYYAQYACKADVFGMVRRVSLLRRSFLRIGLLLLLADGHKRVAGMLFKQTLASRCSLNQWTLSGSTGLATLVLWLDAGNAQQGQSYRSSSPAQYVALVFNHYFKQAQAW